MSETSGVPVNPTTTTATTTGARVHSPEEGDDEIVYYEGRPQVRADQMKAFLWTLLGIALLALPIVAHVMGWAWWRWPMTIICIVLAIGVVFIPWLILKSTRYRISNYRIDYERGILKKRIDTLELWHVEDINFEQGLIDRMCNVGSITVMSHDQTTPKLELHGVPNPRQLFDQLKQRVIAVKRARGVIKMDSGQ
jgi:membrane protein YdbS with pleckstrin-like domain